MLWIWLRFALVWMLRMLVPPPIPARPLPQIDVNAPCPACGHRKGKITCVEADGHPTIRHECDVCGARFHEQPVLKDASAKLIWPRG